MDVKCMDCGNVWKAPDVFAAERTGLVHHQLSKLPKVGSQMFDNPHDCHHVKAYDGKGNAINFEFQSNKRVKGNPFAFAVMSFMKIRFMPNGTRIPVEGD